MSNFENKEKVNLDICEEKFQRIMQENWSLNIPIKPKLRTYKLYKDKVLLEKYFLIPKHQRSVIAKFRSGSLPLAIEIGRYKNNNNNNTIISVWKIESFRRQSLFYVCL